MCGIGREIIMNISFLALIIDWSIVHRMIINAFDTCRNNHNFSKFYLSKSFELRFTRQNPSIVNILPCDSSRSAWLLLWLASRAIERPIDYLSAWDHVTMSRDRSGASDGPAAALYGSPAAATTLAPARRCDEFIVCTDHLLCSILYSS